MLLLKSRTSPIQKYQGRSLHFGFKKLFQYITYFCLSLFEIKIFQYTKMLLFIVCLLYLLLYIFVNIFFAARYEISGSYVVVYPRMGPLGQTVFMKSSIRHPLFYIPPNLHSRGNFLFDRTPTILHIRPVFSYRCNFRADRIPSILPYR